MQKSLSAAIAAVGDRVDQEKVLEIVYRPQALFRVRAVTRCSSSMPGQECVCVCVSVCMCEHGTVDWVRGYFGKRHLHVVETARPCLEGT